MRHFTLLGLSLLLLLLSACGDSTSVTEQEGHKYRELINESNELERAAVQNRMFRLTSQRDLDGLKSALTEARYALRRLSENPTDRLGIELGYRAIKEYQQHVVVRGEVELLERFFGQVGVIVSNAASNAGVNLRDLDWRLFSYNFSVGVSPFGVYSTASNWDAGISLDRSYVSVRGPHNKSWLISPTFDLTKVHRPSFQILHQTQVDRNTRAGDPFNRTQINNEVFRAYVSTDFSGGNPEQATWEEVELGKLPSGVDFHALNSPKIDLSPFISPNTTIAFVFNADRDSIGSHYLTWQVQNFHLFGAGEIINMTPRHASLFKHEFNRNTLTPFQQMSFNAEGPQWEPFGFSGNYRFAKIEANGTESENWLLSPKYHIENVEQISLSFQETFRNPQFENMEILVSTDYSGGDPRESQWDKIERADPGPIDPNDWVDINNGPFDISHYKDQSIVVGFRYTTSSSDNNVWEVESLDFRGLGEPIRSENYDFSYEPPGGSVPDIYESKEEFDFNNGDNGFAQEIVSGEPATWNLRTRNDRQYFNISGHQEKEEGRVRLVSPPVFLTQKAGVQIEQAMNFYPQDQRHRELVRYFIRNEAGEEEEIFFDQTPSGTNWNVVTTEVLMLNESYIESEVQLILEYAGEDDIYPNWDVYRVEFFYEREDEQ